MIRFLVWLCNKKLNPIETELFIGDRKLNIPPAFIKKSYLKVSKDLRLNITSQTKSFRQNLSNHLLNITLTKKIKALNNKIEANEAQYPADTRLPGDLPWRFPKGPNVRDLQEIFRGLLWDQQKNWWFDEKSVF